MTNDQLLDELNKRFNKPMNQIEAADYLHISKSKMYELMPYIPHSIVGGKRLFMRSDLDAYIRENRVEGRP